MEKAAAAADECFTVSTGDMSDIVVHSEEVVTSNEMVVSPPQPAPVQPQQVVYNIPTFLATTPGSNVMQVVTLQTVQQTPAQANLTNALRNIRLIAVQPRLPNGLTNGRPTPRPVTLPTVAPRPEFRVQLEGTKKVGVNTFYSKLKPAPVVLAPKQTQVKQPQPKPPPQPVAPKPSPSYYKEQQREREMKEYSHLNEELQRGIRILLDLTTSLQHATIWPFKERVDPVKDGAPDYDQVITRPMWLDLIKEKFKKGEYAKMSDFVADMRLLLENCYRYNGPNHPITKKALRLEQCMEQKLALLPASLRAECALPSDPVIEAERKTRSGSSESYFSVLLHRVRHERQEREQRAREKKLEEQRLRREEKERQRCLWAEQMMNPQVKAEMRLMWEIPQIGHFLHLARAALHIGEIAQYELEHMFLMPEASVLLATLMTSLLSSPNQRVKLAESPPTPYAVWSARISSRVVEWYRTYNKEGRNFVKVHELLGLEPMFWRVCGETNPLEGGRRYHQLSFLKRVWIFKGLCDTVAHSHKTVQEAMAEEEGPESRQVTLGQDAEGFTYLHFPAVSGSDIRVYRQKNWDLNVDPIWGPIAAERKEQEEERLREEEIKQAALKRARKKGAATNRRAPAPKKPSSPSKKKQPARTPKSSPAPTPQRRRGGASSEERPSRIGTRVSPRTLQRQTGLTLYKDTSSESEESEEEASAAESEAEAEAETEEMPEEASPEEPAVTEESVQPATATTTTRKAPRKRARNSWRSGSTRSRRRPAKKKLPEIAEEAEEEAVKEEVTDEMEVDELKPSPDVEENTVVMKSEEAVEAEDKECSKKPEPVKVEPTDEGSCGLDAKPEVNGVHDEPPVKMECEQDESVIKKDNEEAVGLPDAQASPSTTSSQRFTVSQLLEKLSPSEAPEEVESTQDVKEEDSKPENVSEAASAEEGKEIKSDLTPAAQQSALPDIPDPDRSAYDPFFFELIISSVEQLQEWIERFQDVGGKPRARCEVKLRERLQSLLEEAQPLAADQQNANQKICQQLWKEWERYKEWERKTVSSSGGGCQGNNAHLFSGTDSEYTQESGRSDESGDESEDSAGSSDDGGIGADGVRHSKRLRKRRNHPKTDGSTRSSSPMEEEQPPAKQSRKGSYNYDPGWDSDPSTQEQLVGGSRRTSRTFTPEMKNPDYWIGRRMTRATAAFAGDVVEDEKDRSRTDSGIQEGKQEQQSDHQSPASGAQSSDPLVDQLRQLRRQQALLSSNDIPKAGSEAVIRTPSSTAPTVPNSNGSSPAVFFPSKDAQGKPTLIRITNPKAAELLTKLKHRSSPSPIPRPAGVESAPTPKRIFLSQQPAQPSQPPVSIDITHLVSQAVEKGLIVPHEPRHLSMDVGEHGHFLVSAQMTPNGPKVLSATPLPPKNAAANLSAAAPPAMAAVATTTTAATTAETSTGPLVNANSTDDHSTVPAPPAEVGTSATNGTVGSAAPSPVAAPASVPIAGSRPAVLVNDTRHNNVISPEILKSVAGPDAGDAKLSVIKEGNAKILTLILSNGEMRRLTNSQVQQIQDSIRNNRKSPPTATTTPTPTSTPSATAADAS